ncbi:hypothetical protein ACH4RG_25145 [Streptomyces sp. NPDC021019]|uniref:hypothetical protein n=1 Tax=Streptomyces sp. NPDC021019 TaxID=3365108 RepID=UPI0037B8B18C
MSVPGRNAISWVDLEGGDAGVANDQVFLVLPAVVPKPEFDLAALAAARVAEPNELETQVFHASFAVEVIVVLKMSSGARGWADSSWL